MSSILYKGVAWIIANFGFTAADILSPRKYARFAIQKVAYLLHYLGVDGFRNVVFNLYLRGPYSPELADVYYKLAKEHSEEIPMLAREFRLPEKYCGKVRWFMRKRYWWMEVATTMLMIHRRHPMLEFDQLYLLVRSAKPWVDKRLAYRVYKELKYMDLIN